MSEENEDLGVRADLEAAYDEQEKEESGGSEESAEEQVRTPAEEDGAGDESDTGGEDTGGDGGGEDGGGEDKGKGDEEGKGETGEEEEAGEEEKGEEESGAETSLAPKAWKAPVREHWGKLPKEVQEEVLRREGDIAKFVQNVSEDAKYGGAMAAALKPFEAILAMEAPNPFTAVQAYVRTAAQLRTGSPGVKAKIIADLVRSYDVDIETLDKALVGEELASPEEARMASLLDQRLKPVQEFMSRAEQARTQYTAAQSETTDQELAAFQNDPKNEFFSDVRMEMADLIEMAHRAGRSMTLASAYDLAVNARPELKEVMDKRNEANRLRERAKKVADKKAAASGLKSGTPTPAHEQQADDLRGALESAWENAETS